MKITQKAMLLVCPLLLATAACSTSGNKSEAAMERHAQDASKQVSDSTVVLQRMEADPTMAALLRNARGVFIVPHYGQAALGIGGKGGEGIVLAKNGNTWSDPAFYNFGGVTLGLQAGAEGGAIAFVMNNDKAVQQFMNNNNFQFSANAGLTIVNWSRAAQAELSRADVVAWTDARGLFGGAAVGLQDVRFDQNDTSGFYGRQASTADILSGRLQAPEGKANDLKRLLRSSGTMSGSSSSETTY